jgi:DNA-binding NarL/FixJ family response regulator
MLQDSTTLQACQDVEIRKRFIEFSKDAVTMIAQPCIGERKESGVLLVDDQPAVRQGLRLLLQLESRIVILGEAGSAAEALALAEVLRPDVVIMDVEMPGMDGIEATALLVAMLPQCSVIILTINGSAATRARAMSAGARAFVEKGRPEEIEDAIRQVSDCVQWTQA